MQSYGNLPNWQIFYAPFTFFNKTTLFSNYSAKHRDAQPHAMPQRRYNIDLETIMYCSAGDDNQQCNVLKP